MLVGGFSITEGHVLKGRPKTAKRAGNRFECCARGRIEDGIGCCQVSRVEMGMASIESPGAC